MEVPRQHLRRLFIWCLQYGLGWMYHVCRANTKKNSGREKRPGALKCKSHWKSSSSLGALHLLCWLESCHRAMGTGANIPLATNCVRGSFHGPHAPSLSSCERPSLLAIRSSLDFWSRLSEGSLSLGLPVPAFPLGDFSAGLCPAPSDLGWSDGVTAQIVYSKQVVGRTQFSPDCALKQKK